MTVPFYRIDSHKSQVESFIWSSLFQCVYAFLQFLSV